MPYYFNYFSFFPFSHWIFHYLPYIFISSLSLILSLSFPRNPFNLSFSQILFLSSFLPLFIFLISNLHIYTRPHINAIIFSLFNRVTFIRKREALWPHEYTCRIDYAHRRNMETRGFHLLSTSTRWTRYKSMCKKAFPAYYVHSLIYAYCAHKRTRGAHAF